MMEVVGGVKSILFGDEATEYAVSAAPPQQSEESYVSPLEN
jgi:hypothetical protein